METTRWSGADWAEKKHDIMIIGIGGIGSWTALNLARIGHTLVLVDPDVVDATNVNGGQFYQHDQVGQYKTDAIYGNCRKFGCITPIDVINSVYNEEYGMTNVCITGLDNMAARRQVFEVWEKRVNNYSDRSGFLFIDARLTMEMYEILSIQGNNPDQIRKYKEKYLFTDEQANLENCTTKQSTFGAMGVASKITALLCNWVTNSELDVDLREIPFYLQEYLPLFRQVVKQADNEKLQENEKEPAVISAT